MATYYSSFFTATENGLAYEDKSPRAHRVGDTVGFRGTITIATNLETDDIVRFISVPKGARLQSFTHEWGDLDSATALVMDLGWETTDQNAFLAGSTIYQAADTTIASGGGSNSVTAELTELVFDNSATTAADYLSWTVTTGATSLAATRTVTFQGTYIQT